MNNIVRNLTIENFKALKSSFENSKRIFWDEQNKKLIHPGEYGSHREDIIKDWLSMYIPSKFDISSGFVITSDDKISTQCDIIIYDGKNTPVIENTNNQKFFPIETVIAIGEVKSDINSIGLLNEYLIKLSEIKKLRQSIQVARRYSPHNNEQTFSTDNPFDNIFTFLICNKFNFTIDPQKLKYKDVEQKYKHNIILSLHDGVFLYETETNARIAYPQLPDVILSDTFIKSDNEELPLHVLEFLNSINIASLKTSLFDISMVHYLTNNLFKGKIA